MDALSVAVSLFVSVTVCDAPIWPKGACRDRESGTEEMGPTPLPERPITSGLVLVLSLTVIAPG